MLTNNNNTPSSAPPPPPPPPPPSSADWRKNWRPEKNNDKNENILDSTPSKTSNSTQLKRGLSEVSNSNLFEELKNNSKFKEANNANGETADEGSKNSIHVKNPETRNSAQSKEEDNASDKTKNDRSNAKQGVPKKPMTEQHSGVQFDKDKLGEMKCESKNQKSSLAEQKKATGLKYSIAILLLCTSGAVAGICTYFMISAVLSGVAVPVLFAVIASVSALVMLSSAVYLINPHISAINSEKGVDPGRKQSQDLQEAKELEQSNTYTSSLPVTPGTPSAPTPPTLKNNTTNKSIPSGGSKQQESGGLIAELKSRRKATDEEDDVQQQNNKVCQNQSQNSDSQAAKKLEHSKSEDMQQMDSVLTKAVLKQRRKNSFQDEKLDSLDGQQYDSLWSFEEEQCKVVKQQNPIRKPNKVLSILIKDKRMETKFLQPESPINNLSSNSANVPDDEDWETQPNSMPYIPDKTKQEKIKDRYNHNCSASSSTQVNNVEPASSDMQDPSTVSFKDRLKIFEP